MTQKMRTYTLTPLQINQNSSTFRRRILRIHGAILLLVAVGSALYSTIARLFGVGVYGFLQQDPITWTGLIQAYLLMAIIAGLIWLGAGEPKACKWHVVGAVAHLPPAVAVIFSWGTLTSLGFTTVAIVSLTFHTFWIVIETLAARHPEIDTDHKESLP